MSNRTADPLRLADRLGRVPALAGLDAPAREALAAAGTQRSLRTGAFLFRAHTHDDRAALVLAGALAVHAPEAPFPLLRVLGEGSLVGLAHAASQRPSADVRAHAPSRVLVLPGSSLRAAFQRSPEAALAALSALGDLVAKLTHELAEGSLGGPLAERLHRRVVRLADGRSELAITHAELARHLGAERATVSRALRDLEARGVLRRLRGRLQLVHPPATAPAMG